MLQIVIPAIELWDESKEEFVTYQKEQTLQLEHSLVSLSKWEEVWCKPFLETEELTYEETLDYIKFMTLTKNVDPSVYERLTRGQMKQITDYIKAPRTATTFTTQSNSGGKKERITSELVYYWMFSLQIPIECQKWHLNRLLTLIRIFNVKNGPQKKMSKRDVAAQYAKLNAERRAKLNSKG